MRTGSFVLAIVALMPFARPAPAAESQREVKAALIEEYLSISGAETAVEEALRLVFDQTDAQIAESLGYTAEEVAEMDADERIRYENSIARQRKLMGGIVDRLLQRVDLAELAREVSTPVLDRYYSEADLRALIAFAKTPTGQKQIEHQAKMGVEIQNATQKALLPVMGTIIEELQKEEEEAEKRANPAKRAMSDIRTIATAVEAYAVDEDAYPSAVTISALASLLEPTYVRELPQKDPWGEEYIFLVSADRTQYRILSGGGDKSIDGSSRVIAPYSAEGEGRENRSTDEDIVYQDGRFVAWAPASATEP